MLEFTEEYPDLSRADIIAMDIETYDPNLSSIGPGVYRNDGFILGVSIATDDFSMYYNLGHYDCKPELREKNVAYIRYVMGLPVDKLGANILYDIDWLQNWIEFNKSDYRRRSVNAKVNGRWLDVQVAEPLINENQRSFSLDTLGEKYLGIGKYKTEIDQFCIDNNLKGDTRAYLYKMPYNLVRTYAEEDVKLPLQIFKKQMAIINEQGLIGVFNMETDLLRAVLHMRNEGAIIDTKARDKNIRIAVKQLAEANNRLKKNYGTINYNSSQQIAKLLEHSGIEFERKLVYTNKQGVSVNVHVIGDEAKAVLKYMKDRRSCNETEMAMINRVTNFYPEAIHSCNPTVPSKFLEALDERFDDGEQQSEVLKDLLFCRKADKILNTFLAGSLTEAVCNDGRIHPTINTLKGGDDSSGMSGTITGRFSMQNPNLQQIPSKGKNKYWGNMCRECFIPKQGYWFAKTDYSQVEYRILSHYAALISAPGSAHLCATYRDDPNTDYHQYIQDTTGLERSYAKNLNFGIMYGMGISKMMLNFGWTREFCEEVLRMYHSSAPYVKYTMNKVSDQARKKGYIRTLSGRHEHVESQDKLYKMLNKLIQGSAADIMKKAMVDIEASDVLTQLINHITVHDELDSSVPQTADGIRALFKQKKIMESAYPLEVPLKAEIEIGTNWANVKVLEFDILKIDKDEHAMLKPYFKEKLTHNFGVVTRSQKAFLAGLTDFNVVEEVNKYIMLCADVEQAKKTYKKAQ